MHMPAEQAFWCLVSICEKYLPGYYSAGLVSAISKSWCMFWTSVIDFAHNGNTALLKAICTEKTMEFSLLISS